jgi:hypothetical protein
VDVGGEREEGRERGTRNGKGQVGEHFDLIFHKVFGNGNIFTYNMDFLEKFLLNPTFLVPQLMLSSYSIKRHINFYSKESSI